MVFWLMRVLPIGLAAVNNVIIYDEFSNSHDGSQCFHIMLILPLDPMLESGACAASFGQQCVQCYQGIPMFSGIHDGQCNHMIP